VGADREPGFPGNGVSNCVKVSMKGFSGGHVVSGTVELIHDPFYFGESDVLAPPCQLKQEGPADAGREVNYD